MSENLKFNEVGRLGLPGTGKERRRLALGIGVFDGVHLGHRRIMDEVVKIAAETGAVPAAMTFDPHPRAVLRPDEPPVLLVSLKERVRLLREAGAELVWVVPFTPEFANLEPDEFLADLLEIPEVEITGISVGENWRFGRGGVGSSVMLGHYAQKNHWKFVACPELEIAGETVSSSAIRRAIAAGKLDYAARLLGRPYRLTGTVERGFHDAETVLDRPTANLTLAAGILPPDGVYAGKVFRGDEVWPAAVNIGYSPTFRRERPVRRVEVHLLGFSGNLYGSELGVELLKYLREERIFTDPEALKRQIARDIEQINTFFHAGKQ